MTSYMLDTNIVTAYLKRNAIVRGRIRDAELAGQPVQLAAFERLWRVLGIVLLDHAALNRAAELYAELRSRGQLIEDADVARVQQPYVFLRAECLRGDEAAARVSVGTVASRGEAP
jgi:hypothetical protein